MAGLQLARRASEDRPYVVVNFVASADGRATFGGRSGQLGDDGDRTVFHSLRKQADAVLVGTVTLRTERYGPLVKDANVRHERAAAGRTAEPLAVVVTRSGDVPVEIPLFEDPEAAIVVFGPTGTELSECGARVELIQLDPGELSFATVMRHLRTEHDVRVLLCEGGPTVFGALLRERMVDELFLTVAPKLTGGGHGPTISSGPELPEPAALRLEWVLERNGSLYLRYALASEPAVVTRA
jgi:riboflavin-specific deaminase-like protein